MSETADEKPPLWVPVAVFLGMFLFAALLNWRVSKEAFAHLMIVAGVDWPGMSDGDKLDAFLAFVIGVPSLTVGGLGTYLAWMAIKMGRENEVVTARQMELAAGQKDLLEELGKLEKRQTEIAELQQAMVEAQSQRRMWPVMSLSGGLVQEADGKWHYTVYIHNSGNKTAKDLQYELYIRRHVNFTHTLMNAVQAQSWYRMPVDGGTRAFKLLRGHLTLPVHPKRAVDIGTIVADADLGAFPMLWMTITEDDLYPYGDHKHAKLVPLFYNLGKDEKPVDNS